MKSRLSNYFVPSPGQLKWTAIHLFQRKIAYGDPAREILDAIESEKIDLVVMGTHGRKGLENVLFGSVARNVVRRSPVPVLTVNPYKVK